MDKELIKKLNLLDERRRSIDEEVKQSFSEPLYSVYVREVGYPLFGYKEMEPNYWYDLMSIYDLQKLLKRLNKPFCRPINPSDLRDKNDIPLDEMESGKIVQIDILPNLEVMGESDYIK